MGADHTRHIAIIVAAGRGTRMQADKPKVLLELAGKPVLAYTLKAFVKCPWMDAVIVVAAAEYLEEMQEVAETVADDGGASANADMTTKSSRSLAVGEILVVPGGAERTDSVRAGLAAAGEWLENLTGEPSPCQENLTGELSPCYVYIHDGARPLISQEVLERVRDGVMQTGACVCGVPVKDTIREVSAADGGADTAAGKGTAGDSPGKMVLAETFDRSRLRAIQTPQAFDLTEITAAYDKFAEGEAGSTVATDDAMVYEAATGKKVMIVEGDYRNIKLTTPEDMITAEALVSR